MSSNPMEPQIRGKSSAHSASQASIQAVRSSGSRLGKPTELKPANCAGIAGASMIAATSTTATAAVSSSTYSWASDGPAPPPPIAPAP